ncbi:hypothetical protein quinque_001115 [Culex quinquefasciatus]
MTKVLLRSVLALFPLLRWSSAALNEPLSGACINQYGPPKFPVRVVAAKLIFMVFDNEGHSAFNSFDGMEQYGNCIDVHLTYDLREFNVTVACHGVSGRTVATTGGPWESMSMALSNYSNGLFVLNACTNVDGNATRRGSFMVQTKEQFDKLFRKEEGFDRVYFEYDEPCQCSFRNEFVMSFDDMKPRTVFGLLIALTSSCTAILNHKNDPFCFLGPRARYPIRMRAKIVAMVPDNHGHSPFNWYEQMHRHGPCLDVFVDYRVNSLNFTVSCQSATSTVKPPPGIIWDMAHIIFDNTTSFSEEFPGIFELYACNFFNKTHLKRGRILFQDVDNFDNQSLPKRSNVEHPGYGMVYFEYDQPCSCSFRNVFVYSSAKRAAQREVERTSDLVNLALSWTLVVVISIGVLVCCLCHAVRSLKQQFQVVKKNKECGMVSSELSATKLTHNL